MKKLLLLLFVFLVGCSKEDLLFQKVKLEQNGEHLRLFGFLQEPVNYEFAYSVRVKFCKDKDGKDQYDDFLVVIKPGQVTGFADYVTDRTVMCKFISYEIQWQTHLEQ